MSTLIAYFSVSGTTARVARQLADGNDLLEIKPKQKYTNADVNWRNKSSRSSIEMNDPNARPELADTSADLSQYDTICVGFPIWWYTAPRIINTFLESYDLAGKRIILFATSGGSGINSAVRDLRDHYPNLNIVGGRLLNGRVTPDILSSL